jgi:predicted alpha/beta-hydrolase family hydrolase
MKSTSKLKGLLLTPGAGSSSDHPTLLAIEQAVKPLPVLRHDFPYRRNGKKAPDRAPILLADIDEAAAAFAKRKKIAPSTVVLGGRSMGGRICSMAVADGLPAAGLILISYPLHPPGKPDKLRIEHLPSLEVPCLFISGTRDAFGTPKELERATKKIPGPVTHVWIEGGTHELKKADDQITDAVVTWLRGVRSASD